MTAGWLTGNGAEVVVCRAGEAPQGCARRRKRAGALDPQQLVLVRSSGAFVQKDGEPPVGSSRKDGGDLLSQAREGQVPSALRGLTALFGMGRGVSPSQAPPKDCETGLFRALKTAQLAGDGYQRVPSSPRSISTGLLSPLLGVHIRPINLVLFQGSYSLEGMGELISRWASRLDAFSGYPVRT